MSSHVGGPLSRVDGFDKVSGEAPYAADFDAPRLSHGLMVQSTIGKGRIARIRSGPAEQAPGVLLVMTHANAPRLPEGAQNANPPGERALSLLQDDEVRYNGEPVAVVVAETLEQARYAAGLLEIEYEAEAPAVDFQASLSSAYAPPALTHGKPDSSWGDAATALQDAPVQHVAVYSTPMENHNPMEPHATLAEWNGDFLTLHDSTQAVVGTSKAVAKKLGIAPEKVRVLSPYVGGGFGCKGSAWSHVVLAAMAARQAHRPVRLVVDRTQMFGPVGYRPPTRQEVALGADLNGKIVAIRHDVVSPTSTFEDWTESSAVLTRMLYDSPNTSTSHRLVKLNLGTPTFQRAPGEATGSFALETALDELAWKLGIDPVELRLRNYAEKEPESGKPWSSKKLRECYRSGAERFGWSRRAAHTRAVREGDQLIGVGMATATYPANRQPASATVTIAADGSATVECATQDIGTGTYTIITQVAADELGMAPNRIHVKIGDSKLPEAPVSGGSMTAASVTPAVQAAARQARRELIAFAIGNSESPLHGLSADEVACSEGWIRARNGNRRDSFAAVIARNGGTPVQGKAEAKPGEEKDQYATHSFGAVFAEVGVDPDLGEVRVRRIVGSYSVGSVLNVKTATSQLFGGVVWGIGMALHERTIVDLPTGRILNANLAQYHVPVNADVPEIDISFVDEDDRIFNPLGARGIGEIGITAVPAAIANAVYHASGRRIRDLPITPEKLLGA